MADRTTVDYTVGPGGHLLLWVWLGGKTPARFVLDTGSSFTLVSDTLATRLGLKPAEDRDTQGRPARDAAGQALRVVTVPFQFGSIRYTASRQVVTSGETLSRVPADGILGVNSLLSFPVFLDFQRQQATFFYATPVTAAQLHSLGMDGAAVVPLTDPKGNFNFAADVRLTAGERRVTERLVIDTGDETTFISEKSAQSLGLKPLGPDRTAGGLYGTYPVSDVVLPSLAFGADGPEAGRVFPSYVRGGASAISPPHVGRDVLHRFRVLLDFGAKKMYLTPGLGQATLGSPVSPPAASSSAGAGKTP